jgi:hypothetical protein
MNLIITAFPSRGEKDNTAAHSEKHTPFNKPNRNAPVG